MVERPETYFVKDEKTQSTTLYEKQNVSREGVHSL